MSSRAHLLALFVLSLFYAAAAYRFVAALVRKERFSLRGFKLWVLTGGALSLLRVAGLWYVASRAERYSGALSLWPPWLLLSPELLIAEVFNPRYFYIEYWGEPQYWIFMSEFITAVSFALASPALLVGLRKRAAEGRSTGNHVRTE